MFTFVPRLLPDSYIVMVQQDLDGTVIASDSPRSSVKIWLDGLPDPVQYQSAADHLTSESLQEVKQRQRKRNDNTGNPNKRSKLAVICSNKIHEHQESSRVSTRIMAQQQQAFSAKLSPTKLSPTKLSPTKQPAPGPFPRPTRSSTRLKPTGISGDSDPASLPTQDLAIATPKKPARRQNKMNAGSIPDLPDLDCTPIARMNPSSAPPSFPISANPAGSLVSPTKSSDSGPHPESSISNKISKSSGSRSSSPAKQARDLKLSSVRVEWLSATPPQNNSFSTADQAFYQSMKRIGTGDQVIPESVKRKVTAHMRTTESLMLEDHRITHYFASNNQFVEESTRAKRGLSYTEVFNTAAELYQAAIDCRDHEVPEPSWNSHVHTPLFKLALGGYWKEEKMVGFHDITTAAIGDPSLLPVQASNDKPVQSRKVDYAIVLRLSPNVLQQTKELLIERGDYSINQTQAEYLRFSPIVVNIEKKRPMNGQRDSKQQLGTWTAAHFARLRRLKPSIPSLDLPCLPLIMIEGDFWVFHLAIMTSDTQIIIYRGGRMGDTESIIGIYTLLTAVRRTAQWANEIYRPWFEQEILGMT